jgi:hypothetical protein
MMIIMIIIIMNLRIDMTIMFRLSLSEQEKVIMDEYNLGWAARAERVRASSC